MSASVVITLDTQAPSGRLSGTVTTEPAEPFVLTVRSTKPLSPSSSAVLITASGLIYPVGVTIDGTSMSVTIETAGLVDDTFTLRITLYDLTGTSSVMDAQLRIVGVARTVQVDHVITSGENTVEVTQMRPLLVELVVTGGG